MEVILRFPTFIVPPARAIVLTNPFSTATIIPYRLGETGMTTVNIYREDGTLVETIVQEVQEPGECAVEWDAQNVTSGVYIYTPGEQHAHLTENDQSEIIYR